jgi:hypothetical protein
VQPDGSADSFPVALRRAIGLVRLSGDDRNDRDLRLVQGSALDRLLSDKSLRSRIASELGKNDVKNELSTEAQTALRNLNTAFESESLPAGLDLAITGGQGASITSMIGLTADRHGVQLPLASWGAVAPLYDDVLTGSLPQFPLVHTCSAIIGGKQNHRETHVADTGNWRRFPRDQRSDAD